MLTPRNLKTANGAGDYFYKTNGDYLAYMEKNFCGSEWVGKLAETFKLTGKVDETTFRALLDGQLPTGDTLGVEKEGKRLHRAGIDLTMAAPKSVSILWMLGDERLFKAHVESVKATFAIIEKELAQARKTVKGDTRVEKTDNLVAGLFHHFDTRAGEVSLHTHTVVMNMTQRADGAIRALASSLSGSGFSDQIFARQKAFGLIYRQQLASRVVGDCGYDIKINPHDGTFDIEGVPRSLIEDNSSRTEAVEDLEKKNPFLGGKALDRAKRGIRPEKTQLSFDEIKETTEKSARECGWEAAPVIEKARAQADREPPLTPEQQDALLMRVMNAATRQLAEREAVFDEDSLMKLISSKVLGKVTHERQKTVLATFLEKEWLLPVGKNALEVNCYTTPKALALERGNILSMQAGKGTMEAFLSEEAARQGLEDFNKKAKFPMTEGQFKASLALLTSRDRITAIQGYSGVGKTTMMQAVREILEKQSVTLVGVSSTAAASKKLEEESGIPSMTITKFLHQGYKAYWPTADKEKKPLVVLVDEASMLSSRQQQALDKVNQQLGGHLVLCGDRKQIAAIEAGKPFALGQDHGLATTSVTQVVRQPKGSHLYHVSQALIKGEFEQAFSMLRGDMEENSNIDELMESLCKNYLSLSRAEQEETLVITPSNELRKELNGRLREGFIKQKRLGKKSFSSTKLVSKNWTLEEKKQAILYKSGDIIRFNRRNSAMGIKPNTYGQVVGADGKTNTVKVRYQDREITWSPHRIFSKTARAIEVFNEESIDIAKGEKLRWTRNDRQVGQLNSETMIVLSIKRDGQLKVRTESGEKKAFKAQEIHNQHIDYAYTSTVYSSQGQSFKRVLALLDNRHKALLNQALFYVVCTRARSHCKLYLDDIDGVKEQVVGKIGDKTSSIESLKYWLQGAEKQTPKTLSQNLKKSSKTPSKSTEKNSQTRYDLVALQSSMSDKSALIARELMGEPNTHLSTASVLRFGKKGSIAITLTGDKAGCWYDFESGEGGHLLQLLQRERGLSFIEACELASTLTGENYTQGITSKTATKTQKKTGGKPAKSAQKPMDNSDRKAIQKAQNIWQKTQPIKGTIAEQYLKKVRQIDLEKWPKSLGFLPCYYHYDSQKSYPALVLSATRNGKIEAIQVILLDKNTGQKASMDNPKITRGRPKYGAMVDLSLNQKASHSSHAFVAEGPETALSILSAKPNAKVLVSLSEGNLKNVLKSELKDVTFCLDNDGDPKKHRRLLTSISSHIGQHQTVNWVKPPLINLDKSDFNDTLKLQGKDEVCRLLGATLKLLPPKINSDISGNDTQKFKFDETQGPTNPLLFKKISNQLSSIWQSKSSFSKLDFTAKQAPQISSQEVNAKIDHTTSNENKTTDLDFYANFGEKER